MSLKRDGWYEELGHELSSWMSNKSLQEQRKILDLTVL
jgi:hypothetical protein